MSRRRTAGPIPPDKRTGDCADDARATASRSEHAPHYGAEQKAAHGPTAEPPRSVRCERANHDERANFERASRGLEECRRHRHYGRWVKRKLADYRFARWFDVP